MIYFHLPGLFEFYDFYSVFLPLFREHREYFYDWCEIGSIYGAPADCLWGGGRAGFGECNAKVVLKLMNEYNISPRLTFSNSLLREEHLSDKRCNDLCEMFYKESKAQSGIIVHSDLLLNYLKNKYPNFYFVSSTTKVITDFEEFKSAAFSERNINDILTGKLPVTKEHLIQIYFIEFCLNSPGWFDIVDEYRGDNLLGEIFTKFKLYCNFVFRDCGFSDIYLPNLFERIVVFCLLSKDPIGTFNMILKS